MKPFLRFSVLLLICVFFLVSCKSKKEEAKTDTDILKGYFNSGFSVTSKDGKIAFDFENEKITVTKPEILKGTEIYITGRGLTANIYGRLIALPERFSSLTSLFSLESDLKSNTLENLEFKDHTLQWEDCSFTISDDEITLSAGNREFIIKQRTDKNDEKNTSDSGLRSDKQKSS